MNDDSRRVKVMALVRWALLVAVTAVASVTLYRYWGPLPERGGAVTTARYYCPMHPQVTSAAPGECPICHMALEPIPAERTQSHAHTMTPPESPRDAEVAPDGALEGVVPVMLTLDRQQLVGVVSEVVRRGDARSELRVPAVIEAPETSLAQVRVRAPGFIERIAVRETGVEVTQGQVLAWVYSPQVYQTQQELLTASRWASPGADARAGSVATMASAARQSLELLGVAPTDIETILRTGNALRAVPLRAPVAGWVLRREAVLGLYATPETELYRIADLSRVWIIASVHERDLARVSLGLSGRFVATAAGIETPRVARVTLVEPSVSVETRTARVRLELPNPSLALRPGQFGDVIFDAILDAGAADRGWTIPRDAVIDTGRQQYVFVERGNGLFEPRAVRVGSLVGERWEVLEGLVEGERVVTRGAFMVDSESRLRAALASMPAAGASRDGGGP